MAGVEESGVDGCPAENLIKVILKTPKEKRTVEVDGGANVKDFREKVAAAFESTDVEAVCLIFAGKILKVSVGHIHYPDNRCLLQSYRLGRFTRSGVSILRFKIVFGD